MPNNNPKNLIETKEVVDLMKKDILPLKWAVTDALKLKQVKFDRRTTLENLEKACQELCVFIDTAVEQKSSYLNPEELKALCANFYFSQQKVEVTANGADHGRYHAGKKIDDEAENNYADGLVKIKNLLNSFCAQLPRAVQTKTAYAQYRDRGMMAY